MEGGYYEPLSDLEWRGRMSEQVRFHEARLATLNGDLRDLREQLQMFASTLVKVEGKLSEARLDIHNAVTTLDDNRRHEMKDLRDIIASSAARKRDLLLYIAFPIVVGILVGLVLFAITGSFHHH